MGYKFMPKYQTQVKYIALKDKRFTKRISKKSLYNTDGKETYKFLYRWFREGKLNVDIEGAEAFFRKFLGIEGNEYPEESATVRFNAYMHPLWLLKEGSGNFTFSIDRTGRRLHTPFTYMKREAKQFITWGKDKRKLVSLDLKASQPFLLLGLLNSRIYGFDEELINSLNDLRKVVQQGASAADLKLILKPYKASVKGFLERYCNSSANILSSKRPSKESSMSFNTPLSLECLVNDSKGLIEHVFLNKSFKMSFYILFSIILETIHNNVLEHTDIEDFKRYIQGVTKGTFYPFLLEKFEEELNIEYKDKGAFKEDLMAVLYSKLRCGPYIKARKKVFAKHFPTVVAFLDLLKSKNFLGKESYKLPVILLQRLESHIMLDRIGKRIASLNANLPIFSIHDNMVTLEGYEHFVEKVIKEEMEKCIGFVPMVSKEIWGKFADLGINS